LYIQYNRASDALKVLISQEEKKAAMQQAASSNTGRNGNSNAAAGTIGAGLNTESSSFFISTDSTDMLEMPGSVQCQYSQFSAHLSALLYLFVLSFFLSFFLSVFAYSFKMNQTLLMT
jgi:hypothetical protein